MQVVFDNSELERLAFSRGYTGKWDSALIRSYRKKINLLLQVVSRKDLYGFRSLHLEKLKGQRRHQHSIRLNNQYRLIVEFRTIGGIENAVIINIEDYH